MDSSIISPCLFYRVTLNPTTHEPLIATMRGEHRKRFDKDFNACNEAILSNTQTSPPTGYVQCFPKSGLRYYYQVTKFNGNPVIVPNSMRVFTKRPACSGTNNWLEYQIYGKLGQ